MVGGRSQGWVGVVWWASVSVSGECCVVVGGGGGGRGAKPRVGGSALDVGRCVFRGLGQDFTKMVHFRPSENLENNFKQHVVLLEYLPTRYCYNLCSDFGLFLSGRFGTHTSLHVYCSPMVYDSFGLASDSGYYVLFFITYF